MQRVACSRSSSGLRWGLALWCSALMACPASEPEKEPEQSGGSAPNAMDDAPRAGEGAALDADTDQGAGTGAGADAGTCEIPWGVYEPLYTERSGNCGALNDANDITVGNDIQIQKFANVDIETETIVEGCTVQLVQIVRDKQGVPQKKLRGTLSLEADDTLSGEVMLTRYDSNGTAICEGTYGAELRRSSTTLGGAASGQ